MHIEINHDNHVRIDNEFSQRLSGVIEGALAKHTDRVTRVEVHLGDTNAGKGGGSDKRCMIEVKLAGLPPLAVTHEAELLQLAIDGAIEKLVHAVGHKLGKLQSQSTQRKGLLG
jgi:ribosome-associated translation inhibitor RaiA